MNEIVILLLGFAAGFFGAGAAIYVLNYMAEKCHAVSFKEMIRKMIKR
jgi:hypothetical protein